MGKQAELDRMRTESDIAKLMELRDAGEQVETVRAVRAALKCGQPRAEVALAGLRKALDKSFDTAA